MQAKYSLSEGFFTIKARSSDSWVWKCLLNNRNPISEGGSVEGWGWTKHSFFDG